MILKDKFTLKYMDKYGIDNVRGGTFCQVYLNKTTTDFINKMLQGALNKCYKCNESGHFASQCVKEHKVGLFQKILNWCSFLTMNKYCYRCGRNTHTINFCYATTKLNGEQL